MLAKWHGKRCKLQFYIVLPWSTFMFLSLPPCLLIMASNFALPAHLFHPARLFHPVRLLDRQEYVWIRENLNFYNSLNCFAVTTSTMYVLRESCLRFHCKRSIFILRDMRLLNYCIFCEIFPDSHKWWKSCTIKLFLLFSFHIVPNLSGN